MSSAAKFVAQVERLSNLALAEPSTAATILKTLKNGSLTIRIVTVLEDKDLFSAITLPLEAELSVNDEPIGTTAISCPPLGWWSHDGSYWEMSSPSVSARLRGWSRQELPEVLETLIPPSSEYRQVKHFLD